MIDTNKILPVSWAPKLAGLISAGAAFVVAYPDDFAKHPWMLHLAKYVLMGGLAAIGFTAKQVNVTGGNKPNSGNDPSVVSSTLSTPKA